MVLYLLRSKMEATRCEQRHGRRFRVQKRVDGDIRKWTFDNLNEAIKKRDAIFA